MGLCTSVIQESTFFFIWFKLINALKILSLFIIGYVVVKWSVFSAVSCVLFERYFESMYCYSLQHWNRNCHILSSGVSFRCWCDHNAMGDALNLAFLCLLMVFVESVIRKLNALKYSSKA